MDNRQRLEDEAQQSEHVSSLIKSLEEIEGDIAEKSASRDAVLTNIVLQTSEAWKGLVSSRVESILANIDAQLHDLEAKESAHNVASHFVDAMREAASNHHCQLCDQDIEDDKLEGLMKRIEEATSGYSGLTEDEAKALQQIRVRKSTLESMRAESKKSVLELLEAQLSTLDVEIDDATRRKKIVREELERHGDIDELSKDTKENVRQLATCLKKIDNLREGI